VTQADAAPPAGTHAVDLLPWQGDAVRDALAARATWPHALLLCGPAGLGKRTLALHLARALLCEAPRPDGEACGRCPSCHLVLAGQHPDLALVEPFAVEDDGEVRRLETIPVDRIRALSDWAQLSSHRGRAKVAIIVPAERMHPAAANALLKTLEEPPPDTLLVLVAHQPERLPATIRSRCRLMPAPRPRRAEASAWLRAQGVAAPDVALAQAAGSPLVALAAAHAEWQSERRRWLDALARPRGLSPHDLALRIELAAKDERRERLGMVVDWLVAWTADIARVGAGGEATRNPDYAGQIAALAGKVAKVALFRYHRSLLGQRALLAHPLSVRLVAEALLIEYRALFDLR